MGGWRGYDVRRIRLGWCCYWCCWVNRWTSASMMGGVEGRTCWDEKVTGIGEDQRDGIVC
jgi:hypothetical protein